MKDGFTGGPFHLRLEGSAFSSNPKHPFTSRKGTAPAGVGARDQGKPQQARELLYFVSFGELTKILDLAAAVT